MKLLNVNAPKLSIKSQPSLLPKSFQGRRRQLRIAWIGNATEGGGVGGFGRQLVQSLTEIDVDLTVFIGMAASDFRKAIGDRCDNLTIFQSSTGWEWNRWYNRNPLMTFISSFWIRRRAYSQSVKQLLAEHRRDPFDVIVQFSQIELFELRKHLSKLPPLLLFPCVHAAGELRWHRKECRMALRSESRLRHYVVRANLIQRAFLQKKCCQSVHGVIGMSKRFNQLIEADYGVKSKNQAVLYQPVEIANSERVSDDNNNATSPEDGKISLLFVGRISVRKGLEMIVELSKRLEDLADHVSIVVVGGASFWSDYTRVLDDLNPRIARFVGSTAHELVTEMMSSSDILLVPSHYEPGGIVVAEALSAGMLIIASDEVGSAEPLPETVCRKFPQGDMNAFEAQARQLIKEIPHQRQQLRDLAIHEAGERFAPEQLKSKLKRILWAASARMPIGE
jgi:glycosyltransferase involved in cell wall biosynthesis